eukprot:Phypoly_transcript_13887.p1 GENE.Phypoly_transcript_13887~~Phypoly_transcript_13887.p1  ORF type:complete len:326 (+),score=82.77 Phypoly_transcript_13887:99-980(+)
MAAEFLLPSLLQPETISTLPPTPAPLTPPAPTSPPPTPTTPPPTSTTSPPTRTTFTTPPPTSTISPNSNSTQTMTFAALDGGSDVEVHITPLLLLAQELQFTNEGEIFSSDDLAVLGKRHYGLRVEVLRPFSSRDVIQHLLSGYPFLIPYDADKNFAPCVANGHRPHWALVRGFVYKLPEEASGSSVHLHFSANQNFVEIDSERTSWFHTTNPLQGATPPPQIDDAHLYLICQHGKSRNLALWNFASLAQSNGSLAQPDAVRMASGRWRIPSELSALRGSIVLLFPPSNTSQE